MLQVQPKKERQTDRKKERKEEGKKGRKEERKKGRKKGRKEKRKKFNYFRGFLVQYTQNVVQGAAVRLQSVSTV